MKHKILHSLTAIIMLCVFAACSDDDGPNGGKITLPKDQPTNISVAANETEGRITLYSNVNISAWVSDVKDGSPATDIEWIKVNQPHKDDGTWYVNYNLQRNNTGTSRTSYIVVVAEDEKITFTITQTEEDDPDIPDYAADGHIRITCETFEDNAGTGSYKSDGEHFYELHLDADFPREMFSAWTDNIDNAPGQGSDTKCETMQTTEFRRTLNGIEATITDHMVYRPSGREEIATLSEHSMNFLGEQRIAKDGSYRWTDDNETVGWQATYDNTGHIIQMNNNDGGTDWLYYLFTWEDGLLTKIEEARTGNTVTFTYANPSLKNLFKTFDLNWVLPKELETLDFAAGDITKIWASLGYLGLPSTLLATEISEYIKEDNLTYTYRMNYELHTSGQIKVNVAHLVNGVQNSYAVWDFKFVNIH